MWQWAGGAGVAGLAGQGARGAGGCAGWREPSLALSSNNLPGDARRLDSGEIFCGHWRAKRRALGLGRGEMRCREALALLAAALPCAWGQYDSCPAAQLGDSWALGLTTVVGTDGRGWTYTLTKTGSTWELVQDPGDGSTYSLGTSDGSTTDTEGVVSMATTGGTSTYCPGDLPRSATVELRGPSMQNTDGSLTSTEPSACAYALVLYTSGCASSCFWEGHMQCGPCFTRSSFDGYDESAVTENSLSYDSFDVAIDTSREPNAGCAAGYYWANGGPAASRCDWNMEGYNLEGCTAEEVMYNCPALGDFFEPLVIPDGAAHYVVEFNAVQPTERTCTIPSEFLGCAQPADGDTSCPSLDTSAGSYCVFAPDPDYPGTCDTAPFLVTDAPDSTTSDTWITASDQCVGTCQQGLNARINFQPDAVAAPAGYALDSGSPYGDRSNGLMYGWSCDLTADTRDRNAVGSRFSTMVRARSTHCSIHCCGFTLARLPRPFLSAGNSGQRRGVGMRRHALEDPGA